MHSRTNASDTAGWLRLPAELTSRQGQREASGPIWYLLAGGSAISRPMRLFVVIGGVVIYALLTGLGFLLA